MVSGDSVAGHPRVLNLLAASLEATTKRRDMSEFLSLLFSNQGF